MNAVSLFSGIGGLDLGLERAGINVILQVENDPFCQKVLAKHWPNVRRISNVEDVTAEDCDGADLIFGGFPCQPFSSSGQRKSVDDERWLWPEFARLVRGVRPKFVLVENVAGLLYRGGGMGAILSDLASSGYDTEWESVPAASVGAPHVRDRVFIVAYPHDVRWHGPDADEPQGKHDEVRRSKQLAGVSTGRPAPHPDDKRQLQLQGSVFHERRRPSDSGWWATEPDVDRVVHGLSGGLDRIGALGNTVVPQVAEWIGHRLMAVAS